MGVYDQIRGYHMGLNDKISKLHNKILKEEEKYRELKEKKKVAGTLGDEKALLLEIEKKKAYIEGIRAAIDILEK